VGRLFEHFDFTFVKAREDFFVAVDVEADREAIFEAVEPLADDDVTVCKAEEANTFEFTVFALAEEDGARRPEYANRAAEHETRRARGHIAQYQLARAQEGHDCLALAVGLQSAP
jgi:hypothetical protein